MMLSQVPKLLTLSSPAAALVALNLVILGSSLPCLAASQSPDIVHIFVDRNQKSLNHLTVNKNNGHLLVGGVNKLYQLSPNLNLITEEDTGPKTNASTGCSSTDCSLSVVEKLTDNVNKALVIDYNTNSLINCGSFFQGACVIRNLQNISNVLREVTLPVVANDATSSTVAFIAPGPPNPLTSKVLYVGVTHTANSQYRSAVPIVSSRSLDNERMLEIAENALTKGTRMFVNSLTEERFPINYVHGFSSEGFSYFLTTQPQNTSSGTKFVSKLVRICHADQNYYSYTEIPIDCTNELKNYNLVQAAYVSSAGSDLVAELGIMPQDDVLFAVFSESNLTTNRPLSRSALCVYSLKAIRRKFMSNIQNCFAGRGQNGLDFITPSRQCTPTQLQTVAEDFCGLDTYAALGGDDPIVVSPVLSFDEHLTAVAATTTGNDTVVFVGTSNGYLKKIVIETATSAVNYGDVEVDTNLPINSDLHFDLESKHLYVMTEQKVSKVETQNCSAYETCSDCLDTRDPYCGWCLLENKCGLRSNCQVLPNEPLHWISHKSGICPVITNVTPNQLQITTSRILHFTVENLPRLTGRFNCAFSALDRTLITEATRESNRFICPSPKLDLLPALPEDQHHLAIKLSLRRTVGPDLVSTNFTFFDCNSYSSCSQCVSSSFPCDFCVEKNRCTPNRSDNCRNDSLVTGISSNGPSYRSGSGFCPRIEELDSQEILVPSGMTKAVRVRVHITGQWIVQTRFLCRFNISGDVVEVGAQLLADTIYCEKTKFSYTSEEPNRTVPFSVIWGGFRPLDNSKNLHVVIYQCKYMADNSATCLDLVGKYSCRWCETSNTCETNDQCDSTNKWWRKNKE